MKKIISLFVLFLSITLIQQNSIEAKVLSQPTKISNIFEDQNLAKIFAQNNGYSIDTYLSQDDLDLVQFFNISGEYYENATLENQINSISGIEYFRNIEYFDLNYANISSVDELLECTKLKFFSSGNTPLKNINGLKNATQLEYIAIMDAPISDLSPIKGKAKLTSINLTRTQVTDLSPLKKDQVTPDQYYFNYESRAYITVEKPVDNVLIIDNPFKGPDGSIIVPNRLGAGATYDSVSNKIIWSDFSNPKNSYNISAFKKDFPQNTQTTPTWQLEAVAVLNFIESNTEKEPIPETDNNTIYTSIKNNNTTYYYSKMGNDYFNYKTIYQTQNKKIVTTNQFIKKNCKNTRTANSCAAKISKLEYNNKILVKADYYVVNSNGVRLEYKTILRNKKNLVTNLKTGKIKNNKIVKTREARYKYNSKNKLKVLVNYRYTNGKLSDRREYVYNTKSQLKSNKYGNAYYYRTEYKNGKAKKTIRAKYTSTSQKVQYIKVKLRK